VDVLLEKTEDKEGYVVLSKEKAEKMKVWDDVERAYQERRVVTGRVIERVKGGLAVDIGVRAFLPGSQVDLRPVRNLDSLQGQELRMRSSRSTRSAATSCSRARPCSKKRTPRRSATPWRPSRRARSSWAR
jgi:ribosomal protein S1